MFMKKNALTILLVCVLAIGTVLGSVATDILNIGNNKLTKRELYLNSSSYLNFSNAIVHTPNGIIQFNPDGRIMVIIYNGSSNAFQIINNGTGTSNNGLNVVSYNFNDTALGVNGRPLSHGTVKIAHKYNGSYDDSSSSGLSILLEGIGTAAQGIYLDTRNSTGDSIKITNGTTLFMEMTATGELTLKSDSTNAFTIQDVDGTQAFRVQSSNGLTFTKKVLPSSSKAYDMGDSTHIWATTYTQDLNVSRNATFKNMTAPSGQTCAVMVDDNGVLFRGSCS